MFVIEIIIICFIALGCLLFIIGVISDEEPLAIVGLSILIPMVLIIVLDLMIDNKKDENLGALSKFTQTIYVGCETEENFDTIYADYNKLNITFESGKDTLFFQSVFQLSERVENITANFIVGED